MPPRATPRAHNAEELRRGFRLCSECDGVKVLLSDWTDHEAGRDHVFNSWKIQLARAGAICDPPPGTALREKHVWCRACRRQVGLSGNADSTLWVQHVAGQPHQIALARAKQYFRCDPCPEPPTDTDAGDGAALGALGASGEHVVQFRQVGRKARPNARMRWSRRQQGLTVVGQLKQHLPPPPLADVPPAPRPPPLPR